MLSPDRLARNGGEYGDYGMDQELPTMTPPHPPGGSRLDISQPASTDKTPNLAVNKNPFGEASAGKPPSSGLMTKPAGSKPGLFAKPKMTVKKKF